MPWTTYVRQHTFWCHITTYCQILHWWKRRHVYATFLHDKPNELRCFITLEINSCVFELIHVFNISLRWTHIVCKCLISYYKHERYILTDPRQFLVNFVLFYHVRSIILQILLKTMNANSLHMVICFFSLTYFTKKKDYHKYLDCP